MSLCPHLPWQAGKPVSNKRAMTAAAGREPSYGICAANRANHPAGPAERSFA